MVTVVVSGGRDFNDKKVIYRKLDKFHKRYNFTLLVQGDATGVDTLCKEWAHSRGVPTKDCPANWKDTTVPGAVIRHNKYGAYNANAGLQRNQDMIDDYKPQYAIIFPGGTGTANMKARCLKSKEFGIIKKVITVSKRT